jgi:heme/copper-type cytochrome/quinol oxidase subunit 2
LNPLKYLGFVALIPLGIGINLQTGQNIFTSISGLGDTSAAYLGLIFELMAFAVATASRYTPFRILFGVVFMIQAVLVTIWGIIVGMFAGVGAGATKGATLFDIVPWFLSALIYALLGIYTFVSIAKAARMTKRNAKANKTLHPTAGNAPV